MLWSTGSQIQSLFNLLIYHNQKSIMTKLWIFNLLKICSKAIKNNKHHPLKINILYLFDNLSKS